MSEISCKGKMDSKKILLEEFIEVPSNSRIDYEKQDMDKVENQINNIVDKLHLNQLLVSRQQGVKQDLVRINDDIKDDCHVEKIFNVENNVKHSKYKVNVDSLPFLIFDVTLPAVFTTKSIVNGKQKPRSDHNAN